MNNEKRTNGINPTPEFIVNKHTGKFITLLPHTYIIKGAKNDRGFDQGYALQKPNKKEFILIDVVELASKEAVKTLQKDGNKILAILITGDTVMNDIYADLETLSKDAGGAEIYVHPKNSVEGNFSARDLTANDELLRSLNLEVQDLPAYKKGAALIFSGLNNGMLFPGDSAKGAAYDTNDLTFTREKLQNKSDEFSMAGLWSTYNKDFTYFFPRKGKPDIDIDGGTRTDILNRLSRGK